MIIFLGKEWVVETGLTASVGSKMVSIASKTKTDLSKSINSKTHSSRIGRSLMFSIAARIQTLKLEDLQASSKNHLSKTWAVILAPSKE